MLVLVSFISRFSGYLFYLCTNPCFTSSWGVFAFQQFYSHFRSCVSASEFLVVFFFIELPRVCSGFIVWVFLVLIGVSGAIGSFSLRFFEIGFEALIHPLWLHVRSFVYGASPQFLPMSLLFSAHLLGGLSIVSY